MLPSQILPLLSVPGTDESPRLVPEVMAGAEPFSGWLLDRTRTAVARLLNFRFRFTGFDPVAETNAAFRCLLPSEMPDEPAPVPVALDDPRLQRQGSWRQELVGLVARAVPGTRLAFRTTAPRLTLRFLTSPLNGIVQVARDGGSVQELDLYHPVPHLSRQLVVENPGGAPCEIAVAPTRRANPEAEGASITLAGVEEHLGPPGPVRPRPVPPSAFPVPPLLAPFAQLAATLPPGGRALNIGAGPGGSPRPDCLHLDWLPFEGPDLLADPLALPFRSNSMDLVHCNGTINRVADPARLVGEIRRVLKPGGRALIGAMPAHWRRYGGPHLLDINRPGMQALCAGFAECLLESGGGPAQRVQSMLRMGRVNLQRQADRTARLTEDLDALVALTPRLAQEMPFWVVARVRK